jgi:hypothetical protein
MMFKLPIGLLAVASRYLSAIGVSGAERDAMLPVVATNMHRQSWRGAKRSYRPGGNSIAGKPHKHEREIARRLRQQDRIAANRADRLARSQWGRNGHDEFSGLSRSGKTLFPANAA